MKLVAGTVEVDGSRRGSDVDQSASRSTTLGHVTLALNVVHQYARAGTADLQCGNSPVAPTRTTSRSRRSGSAPSRTRRSRNLVRVIDSGAHLERLASHPFDGHRGRRGQCSPQPGVRTPRSRLPRRRSRRVCAITAVPLPSPHVRAVTNASPGTRPGRRDQRGLPACRGHPARRARRACREPKAIPVRPDRRAIPVRPALLALPGSSRRPRCSSRCPVRYRWPPVSSNSAQTPS